MLRWAIDEEGDIDWAVVQDIVAGGRDQAWNGTEYQAKQGNHFEFVQQETSLWGFYTAVLQNSSRVGASARDNNLAKAAPQGPVT